MARQSTLSMPDSWVPMFEGTPGFKWVDPVALTEGAWSAYPGGSWDTWIRSSGPPPVKTDRGWLVLYHAMDKRFPHIGYKLGAMLLDLDNPEKIIAKAKSPILEPDMWYENDWKPGVVYSCGAVEKNGTLYIYYGGGDKYVCVATADLGKLVDTILEENTYVSISIDILILYTCTLYNILIHHVYRQKRRTQSNPSPCHTTSVGSFGCV
jgi:hypothetical protein